MNDDNEDTGKNVQDSPEDIDSEAAAGSEGELKCTPCEHGAGTSQKQRDLQASLHPKKSRSMT